MTPLTLIKYEIILSKYHSLLLVPKLDVKFQFLSVKISGSLRSAYNIFTDCCGKLSLHKSSKNVYAVGNLCFCKPTLGLYLLRLVTNHYLRRELASDENKCIFSLRTYPLKSINIPKRLFRVEVSSFLMQTKYRFLILYSQVNRFRLRHNVIKIDRNILIYRLKVFSTKRQLAKSRLYPYFVIMSFNYGVQNVHIIRSKFRTATR